MVVTFDLSLPVMVDLVHETWGPSAVVNNIFLRDAAGRLTFVVLDPEKKGEDREALSATMNATLRGYADPSGISVATPEELFDDRLREAGTGSWFPIKTARFDGEVRLIDRRVAGGDWLQVPSAVTVNTPRLFFVSLKGGVGRSTAICVLAAHLANSGRRVLAVDLDLEAPGLGSMLLGNESMPKFGILDYLVETNVSEVDEIFISDMIGSSHLAAGRGVIAVIPALGARSIEFPENILSKIARAYLSSDNDPSLSSFTVKIEKLFDAVTRAGDYDIVLVDARAGLHESTAAAAVSLRGDTLLFGINQPQTYVGYKALFSQLAVTLGADWAAHIHFVEARVGAEGPSSEFLSNIIAIMPEAEEPLHLDAIPLELLRETFDVDWDEEAPILQDDAVLRREVDSTFIFESDLFHAFDPLRWPDRLDRGAYTAIFGNFLDFCDEVIKSAEAAIARGDNAGH